MNLQVSRIWHRANTRPRDALGRFLRDHFLWTRPDKLSRWVYFPDHTGEQRLREQLLSLTEANRRVIRDLVVIVVAAALVFWFG